MPNDVDALASAGPPGNQGRSHDRWRGAGHLRLVHPHGELYHEESRTIDEVATADWAALLAHADHIGFFTRPEPPRPAPDARIFHLTITSGERSCELAIDDPFEVPELAMFIRLTRRAMRDRLVLTPEMLNEQQLEALRMPLVRNGTEECDER